MANSATGPSVERSNSFPRTETRRMRPPDGRPVFERRRARLVREIAADDALRQLRILLSEERVAVDAYRESAGAAAPEAGRRLAEIAERHAAQAAELERQIRRLGGGAAAASGAARLPAAFPVPTSASLRERERLALASYREALDRVDRTAREVLLGSLIPGQFRNVCAWNERAPV